MWSQFMSDSFCTSTENNSTLVVLDSQQFSSINYKKTVVSVENLWLHLRQKIKGVRWMGSLVLVSKRPVHNSSWVSNIVEKRISHVWYFFELLTPLKTDISDFGDRFWWNFSVEPFDKKCERKKNKLHRTKKVKMSNGMMESFSVLTRPRISQTSLFPSFQ